MIRTVKYETSGAAPLYLAYDTDHVITEVITMSGSFVKKTIVPPGLRPPEACGTRFDPYYWGFDPNPCTGSMPWWMFQGDIIIEGGNIGSIFSDIFTVQLTAESLNMNIGTPDANVNVSHAFTFTELTDPAYDLLYVPFSITVKVTCVKGLFSAFNKHCDQYLILGLSYNYSWWTHEGEGVIVDSKTIFSDPNTPILFVRDPLTIEHRVLSEFDGIQIGVNQERVQLNESARVLFGGVPPTFVCFAAGPAPRRLYELYIDNGYVCNNSILLETRYNENGALASHTELINNQSEKSYSCIQHHDNHGWQVGLPGFPPQHYITRRVNVDFREQYYINYNPSWTWSNFDNHNNNYTFLNWFDQVVTLPAVHWGNAYRHRMPEALYPDPDIGLFIGSVIKHLLPIGRHEIPHFMNVNRKNYLLWNDPLQLAYPADKLFSYSNDDWYLLKIKKEENISALFDTGNWSNLAVGDGIILQNNSSFQLQNGSTAYARYLRLSLTSDSACDLVLRFNNFVDKEHALAGGAIDSLEYLTRVTSEDRSDYSHEEVITFNDAETKIIDIDMINSPIGIFGGFGTINCISLIDVEISKSSTIVLNSAKWIVNSPPKLHLSQTYIHPILEVDGNSFIFPQFVPTISVDNAVSEWSDEEHQKCFEVVFGLTLQNRYIDEIAYYDVHRSNGYTEFNQAGRSQQLYNPALYPQPNDGIYLKQEEAYFSELRNDEYVINVYPVRYRLYYPYCDFRMFTGLPQSNIRRIDHKIGIWSNSFGTKLNVLDTRTNKGLYSGLLSIYNDSNYYFDVKNWDEITLKSNSNLSFLFSVPIINGSSTIVGNIEHPDWHDGNIKKIKLGIYATQSTDKKFEMASPCAINYNGKYVDKEIVQWLVAQNINVNPPLTLSTVLTQWNTNKYVHPYLYGTPIVKSDNLYLEHNFNRSSVYAFTNSNVEYLLLPINNNTIDMFYESKNIYGAYIHRSGVKMLIIYDESEEVFKVINSHNNNVMSTITIPNISEIKDIRFHYNEFYNSLGFVCLIENTLYFNCIDNNNSIMLFYEDMIEITSLDDEVKFDLTSGNNGYWYMGYSNLDTVVTYISYNNGATWRNEHT